jgi:hypothetical protein
MANPPQHNLDPTRPTPSGTATQPRTKAVYLFGGRRRLSRCRSALGQPPRRLREDREGIRVRCRVGCPLGPGGPTRVTWQHRDKTDLRSGRKPEVRARVDLVARGGSDKDDRRAARGRRSHCRARALRDAQASGLQCLRLCNAKCQARARNPRSFASACHEGTPIAAGGLGRERWMGTHRVEQIYGKT